MFFFGGGSSILPYVLYLALIWGVFLLNGVVGTTLKNEMSRKSEVVCQVKAVKNQVKTANYQKHVNAGHFLKTEIFHHRYLNQRLDYMKWRFVLSKFSLIQNIIHPFLLRGPPSR